MERTIDTPVRLKLFGGLGLEGTKKLPRRVTQRRQLALLAILGNHDSSSRDRLIGLLWPETTDDRARHLLSDSIYVVRKELGDEAIIAHGDVVRLNPEIVGSDLADFRSAIEDEDFESALLSYGGPFLDGFYPDESEPFERWMVDEREALERQAATAAWALVDRAEAGGDLHEAIRRARRALEIDSDDEHGVRSLIRLQDARGDRAGAVRTYDEFAARLEAELGVEPSAETQALIRTVRDRQMVGGSGEENEPTGAANLPTEATAPGMTTPAQRPGRRRTRAAWVATALVLGIVVAWFLVPDSEVDVTPSAESPAVVAVLPFEVRGEGLQVWREGMVDLVSTNIDVFPELRAVPSRTVLARWREVGPVGAADLDDALNVARRTSARYAVTGNVLGTSEGLRVRGEVFDLQTGAKIGEATAHGPADSIIGIVDRLSVGLVGPLLGSGTRDRRWPRLASTTTSSAVALKAFLEGEALYRTGEYQPAIEAFKKAVEADSTFALAYYRLSESYTWTSSGLESREPAQLAARYAERLPDREARLVRGWGLATRGLPEQWAEMLREAVREHPDDPHAWYWLGEVYYHGGDGLLVRPWEFAKALERSKELDPTFAPVYEHLIDATFQREPDSARARSLIEQYDLIGGGESLDFSKASFQLAFGGPHTQQQIDSLLQGFSAFHLRGMATHDLAHLRFLDLRETVLRTALERANPTWERAVNAWLFWTLAAQGRLEAAIELTEDPVLEGDRATFSIEARAYGYPVSDEALSRALIAGPMRPPDDGSTDGPFRASSTPGIFERGVHAADKKDWATLSIAKRELRGLIQEIDPEFASDTLRVKGLIEALEGYAAWQRGDRKRALVHLSRARKWTIGGANLVRSVSSERNQIIRAWLGALLLEMDRPREALVYYESLGPGWSFGQDPMIYFHLGRIRDDLGDRAGAIEAYELATLAWKNPDPEIEPLAAKARSEAARLRGLQRE